jgi:glutathione-regulated potassium-efflux system ancillary protein KefG
VITLTVPDRPPTSGPGLGRVCRATLAVRGRLARATFRGTLRRRMKVLVLFAHPALERSRVNRALLDAVRDCPGVTFHDLYEAYPDLYIDVDREQHLLLEHDAIVFQHPFFWYSTPAILKEWQDLVLEHGWAYGKNGRALVGKTTFNVLSAGGPETAYHQAGHNRFTVRELLTPYEATAALCGMRYLAPFVVHGTLRMRAPDAAPHVRDYRRVLEALVEDRLDFARAAAAARLNADLDAVIRPGPVGAVSEGGA